MIIGLLLNEHQPYYCSLLSHRRNVPGCRAKALAKFAAVTRDDYYDDASTTAAYWVAQARFHGIIGNRAAVEQLYTQAKERLSAAANQDEAADQTNSSSNHHTEMTILKGGFDVILDSVTAFEAAQKRKVDEKKARAQAKAEAKAAKKAAAAAAKAQKLSLIHI